MLKIIKIFIFSLLFISQIFASAPSEMVDENVSFDDIENFTIGSGHSSAVNSVAFSPDGRYIVSGSYDNSIKLWSVEKKKLIYTYEGHSDFVTSIAFSPDGKTIVSGSSDKNIKLWSVERKKLIYTFEGHSDSVNSVAFSPDGKTIVSGSYDNSIKLWSVEKKKLIYTYEGHSNRVNSVAFSPDGKTIVSGSWDNSIKLWSVERKKLIYTYEGHSSSVYSVAFSPDGKTIVSGSDDKSIKLWSVERKKLIYTYEGHSNRVYSVAFSPDGKIIVSGSYDNNIKLWSVERKKLIYTYEGHSNRVNSVAFSPDGKTIVSGSSDKNIKLWSVERKKLIYTYEWYNYWVNSVAFSPDGKTIVSGANDNSIKLWSVEKKELIENIYNISDNWIWFDKKTKRFNRSDEGTLLMRGDKPILPTNNTPKDNLKISLPQEIDIYSQRIATIEANITNIDTNTSYWIECYTPNREILIYQHQLTKLQPNETKTLSIKLSSALHSLNKSPFSKMIEFKFTTANGEYTTKDIIVHFKTPEMEVKEAKYDSKNKSLIVEIINSGEEAISDLDIRLGKDIQNIEKLDINETTEKSFILAKEPKEINITISKPFYEWNLQAKVTVEDMIMYYIILGVLILLLLVAIVYYRIYKNPLVLRIEKANSSLKVIALDEFEEAQKRLNLIGRFDSILKANKLSKEKFDKIVGFSQLGEAEASLPRRFVELVGLNMVGDDIILPLGFELNINHIKIDSSGDSKMLKNSTDKILALSTNRDIQNSLSVIAKDKTNLLIAPSYEQLSQILISDYIYQDLIKLFRDNLNLKDISPYKISGDVKKENMFFGRVDIISNIINRNPQNYIVVGARQLGKSSLLQALYRRYRDRDIASHYITLDEESDLVFHLSKALGVDRDMESIKEAIYKSQKPIIFLIDEVDKFLLLAENSEKFTSIFRSLSQGGKAYFILAGFWELYKETLQPNSPLRNFGDIIKLEGLEEEACRELITKPMGLLGIGYSSPQIVEDIIYQTGRRSNLVSVICNRLISQIDGKTINQEDLVSVLDGGFTEYISLSSVKIDRVIEFATIDKERFYKEDLYEIFDKYALDVDTIEIEESLNRLELSYVIYQKNGEYRYRVPLFVEKTIKSSKNIENLLIREIGEFKRSIK